MKKDFGKIIPKISEESKIGKLDKIEALKFIIFNLDKEEYAVLITDVNEIIKSPTITPIPGSPDFIPGIFNLRGKIVVVLDLEKRFHLIRENAFEGRHIVITEVGENTFGVMVDQVTEVLQISVNSIQRTPSFISSKIHVDYLSGVVVLQEKESRMLILLDLTKLLQEKELLQISEIVQKTEVPAPPSLKI